MKLFLLDAYALIYRSFYAFAKNPRINSKGLNTSPIYGFVNTLNEVLASQQPTHIAVCFDPSGPTFRHQMYVEYKAQREETPEAIRVAIPLIKQVLEAMNISVIQVDGYEADDVIGTLAYKASAMGIDVYMMTPDKDYGQLVGEHRFMYRPKHSGGFETLGIAEVCQKWSLSSVNQVIDMLALMGDSSDNIPGCPGVGEKTAVKLLDEFSSVDNLLKNTHQLKGALQKKVIENEAQIRLSYSLATIFTEVPLDFNLDDFIIKSINKEKLTSIYQELEFKNLIDKLNGVSVKTKKVKNENATMLSLFDTSENVEKIDQTIDFQSSLETIRSVQHTYHIVQTDEELQELTNLLLSSDEFCFDTETTSVVSLDAELVGMSFAVVEHEAYYLPFPKEFSEVKLLLDKIKEPFLNSSIRKIGQNMKYDISVLKNYDFEVCGELFDTMIAHYLLNPELYHNMDYMAETILNYSTIRINEIAVLEGKGKNKELNMRAVELQKIADYAAEDADITLQLKNRLAPRLKENKMEELFHSIEMPLVRVLVEMERNGVVVDEFSLQQVSGKMTQYLLSVEQQVRSFSSKPLNVSSPKQIGEFLFDELKLDAKARKTKSGQYVTDEETLEALKNKHEVVPLILEYRGIKKLLSTYIDVLPTLIHRRTGRVHTSFNQTVTATGRLSSSNPNLQNIPIRDEKGKEIRRAFVADQGCKMLGADYSQIELRIMAHLSQDQNLINAFNADQDIHAATASKIFRVPINEVTSDMRRKAKTANFGIIYGISAFGLANRLGISRTEAKQLIDDYFLSFPKVKEYMDNVIEQARKNGYVLTICNRKRYLPDINSHNANVRGFAERNAINAPIQGSSADIIKIAMIRILSRIKSENLKSQMILQIHDELQFNVPNEEVDRLRTIVSEEMSSAIQLLVPLKVDIEIGNNWLETH